MQRFAAQLASSRLLQDTELGSFTGPLLCTASDGTNAPWHQNGPYDGHLLVLSSQHLFFIPITDSPFPDPVYPRYYSGVSTSPRPGQSEHSISRVISSIQFSHSVMSDSLRPHGLQHARLPCLSPTPEVCLNSCPLSQWCHPTTSSCRPLHFLPSIFPASGSFPMSQLFISGGQSTGASASASVLPMNIQD